MAVFKKQELGKQAEVKACQFLKEHGLRLLSQNYRCFLGEIDLIMQDGHDIVFVEVRSKHSLEHGTAIESITRPKQKKIINTALRFLQERNWLNKVNCRFDVIGIHLVENQMKMDWIKNAFS